MDLFRLTLCHHALEASLEKTSLDDYAGDRAHGHSIWIVRRPGLEQESPGGEDCRKGRRIITDRV